MRIGSASKADRIGVFRRKNYKTYWFTYSLSLA